MANFGNQSFTGFRGVNLQGSTLIRVGGFDTFQGTIGILGGSLDGARAWSLPNKNGTFPISGTFAVQLPAIAATSPFYSTIATVAGITAEDGLTVSNQTQSAVYGTETSARIFFMATPGAGNITLKFINIGAATGYTEYVFGYTAVR